MFKIISCQNFRENDITEDEYREFFKNITYSDVQQKEILTEILIFHSNLQL